MLNYHVLAYPKLTSNNLKWQCERIYVNGYITFRATITGIQKNSDCKYSLILIVCLSSDKRRDLSVTRVEPGVARLPCDT